MTASPSDAPVSNALGLALMAFGSEQLRAAQAHLARQGAARHAGIHEARKCLRRVRAMLALGVDTLGSGALRLDIELAQLCRGLSRLRDAQAVIEALHRLDGDTRLPPSMRSPAVKMARQQRDDILDNVLARDIDFNQRRQRLLRAETRLERLDWSSLTRVDLRSALARSRRRMKRARRHAKESGADHQAWHAFRRRLRRWRQQNALLEEIAPKLSRSTKPSDELATALGDSQDDVLLLAHCGRGSPFPPEIRVALRKALRQRLSRSRAMSDQ